MSYFITNLNHFCYIIQQRQAHMNIHIYHVYNILFDLTIMLDFLIITNIATFDVSHEKQNLSLQTILDYQCT